MDATRNGPVQGGSTITQQYVKNALVGAAPTARRKLQEAVLAYQVERRYSKDEILERYLNTIYFGQGASGIEAAAEAFFSRPASSLSVERGALLAALIASPARFDPVEHPVAARARRDEVLGLMREQGYLSPAAYGEARARPLDLRLAPPAVSPSWFVRYVERLILDDPRFGQTPSERYRALFEGGLSVHTTLDPRLQSPPRRPFARSCPSPPIPTRP